MNNFQGMASGDGILKDNYSSAYDALKKRKMKLMESMAKRADQVKNLGESTTMEKPKTHLRARKV